MRREALAVCRCNGDRRILARQCGGVNVPLFCAFRIRCPAGHWPARGSPHPCCRSTARLPVHVFRVFARRVRQPIAREREGLMQCCHDGVTGNRCYQSHESLRQPRRWLRQLASDSRRKTTLSSRRCRRQALRRCRANNRWRKRRPVQIRDSETQAASFYLSSDIS